MLMNFAFFIDFLIHFLIPVKMKYLLLLCAVVVAVYCIVMPVQRNALDCQMCEILVKSVDGTADRDTKEIEKVRLASCMPDPLVFSFSLPPFPILFPKSGCGLQKVDTFPSFFTPKLRHLTRNEWG